MRDMPVPTTKQRMGILKKLGIGAAVALGCLVLAVLVLSQLAARWEARVQPLSVEEVRRLMALETSSAGGDSGHPANRAERISKSSADVTTDDPTGASAGEGSDSAARFAEPATSRTQRLASLPTPDQQARKFSYPNYSQLSALRTVGIKTWLFVAHTVWASIYEVRGNVDIIGKSAITGLTIWSSLAGDADSDRSWLREGIRVENREGPRRYYSSQLAWLEDDPELAAALLEESCMAPHTAKDASKFPSERYVATNALDLCVATGSEDLAEYYYLRYRDSWPLWAQQQDPAMYYPDAFRPEREAWIRNYEAKAASK